MMKRAMDWVVTAVLGVGVVSSGCSTPGGRFAGGVASTIAGGALIVARQDNGCPSGTGCGSDPQRELFRNVDYGVGVALLAVGLALLIPDLRSRSNSAPAPATGMPGAASAAPGLIAPDPEVRVAAPAVGYRM
jgi:hypothetical protein